MEYLVIDSTGCVTYYNASNRQDLISQLNADGVKPYIIRTVQA